MHRSREESPSRDEGTYGKFLGGGELQGDPASSKRDWPACWRHGDGGAGHQLYSTEAQTCSGGPAFRSTAGPARLAAGTMAASEVLSDQK